jgi:hypothetical protein
MPVEIQDSHSINQPTKAKTSEQRERERERRSEELRNQNRLNERND